MALVDPQALDPRRGAPCPAVDARDELAAGVVDGSEELAPVVDPGGGEVKGRDLLAQASDDRRVGPVDQHDRAAFLHVTGYTQRAPGR